MSDRPEDPITTRRGGALRLTAGPVRAVLFDYGLTLVHFARPDAAIDAAQEAIAARIAAAGHPRPDVTVLRAAVHDRVEAEVAAHEAGGDLEEIDVARLEQRAFSHIGLDLDEPLRDECSMLAQRAWWDGVAVYPDVVPALQALRGAGIRLGVCSNAAYRPASMHGQLVHVGLDALLDAAVFSGEVGWRKPSPRLFEAALRGLGTHAGETVFVGDRLRQDIGGAADMGMRTVLIARDGLAPEQPSSTRRADAVIHDLSELPVLLLQSSGL